MKWFFIENSMHYCKCLDLNHSMVSIRINAAFNTIVDNNSWLMRFALILLPTNGSIYGSRESNKTETIRWTFHRINKQKIRDFSSLFTKHSWNRSTVTLNSVQCSSWSFLFIAVFLVFFFEILFLYSMMKYRKFIGNFGFCLITSKQDI